MPNQSYEFAVDNTFIQTATYIYTPVIKRSASESVTGCGTKNMNSTSVVVSWQALFGLHCRPIIRINR